MPEFIHPKNIKCPDRSEHNILKSCISAIKSNLTLSGSSLETIHSGLNGHVYDYMYFLKNTVLAIYFLELTKS